jgi:DNA-binding Xre family transcriptional regulator
MKDEAISVSKVNYDKLWHILIDKKMSKKELRL